MPRASGALALGGAGVLATLASAYSEAALSPVSASLLRDWLPAPLMLVAYHQTGCLFKGPDLRLQAALERLDLILARRLRVFRAVVASLPVARYLEFAYLFAYPLVPLGLAAVRIEEPALEADVFWRVVLPATYFSYMMLAFAPTLPPRSIHGPRDPLRVPKSRTEGRAINVWILEHLGIEANTFPSGHVAAATAASLVVVENQPLVGAMFVWMTASIAVSVVVRRYHYAADSILAVIVALVAWSVGGS